MTPAQRTPSRVTILGLGLFGGGAGAARYFAERGARVVVSDERDAAALAESLAALKDLPIEYHLGGHSERDFAGTDLVVVNPAVRPDAPALAMARGSGARLDTEINLLFRLCPAPIAAVTGTHGKSTTVALLGEMMRATGRRTWVGGNLGGSLLPRIEEMRAGDVVVVEISSFQAERLAWSRRSPHVAVVTNLTPNHLDRHRDMDEYARAKQHLLQYQREGDFALLNADDAILCTWGDIGRGEKVFLGADPRAERGARLTRETVELRRPGVEEHVSLEALRLPGPHNRFNAACAAAAAWLLGAEAQPIEAGMACFNGLPDRLELVAEKDGVRFYNDSIATTPEATLAALDTFSAPIILIAGGSSKNLSFAELGRRIAVRAKAVVLLGATAEAIESAVRAVGGTSPPLHHVTDLRGAVTRAEALARRGDIVLLSPACASYDMFRNYAERGRMFREFVRG